MLCWLCVSSFLPTLIAQIPIRSLRNPILLLQSDTLIKDSLTIIPQSFKILQGAYQTSDFYVKNNLILKKTQDTIPIRPQIVQLEYRVLPYLLSLPRRRLDSAQIRPKRIGGMPIEYDYTPDNFSQSDNLFDTKSLNYSGSFARGISVGNAQNLVVNSAFNLQMAGKITPDLEISAAITDNQIPLQAEGNTRQLREFDKIFIQIKQKNNILLVGDVEWARPPSYFMNLYKRGQGGVFTTTTDFDKKGSLHLKMAAAVAKGKFNRYTLPQQEGNQGPYHLAGTDGASFLIVLSGTEKVYFDGLLLQRGEDADYIMDYNRGEIQFTAKKLVTKDSRIIVEYEFADQNYLRTMYGFESEYKNKKFQLKFNFFSEQDSKNASGTQNLDSLEKTTLRLAGNRSENAVVAGWKKATDGFNRDRIMYKLTDTTVNNVHYSNILVYATNPDSALYLSTFTPVGEGKGNYIQAPSSANGRVYQWVAPQRDGTLSGRFEPIKPLIAPIQQQLMTLGADYQIHKNLKVFAELALSNQDKNLFSELGDSLNVGWAAITGASSEILFGKKAKKDWLFQSEAKYEYTNAQFKPLNPYRPAEFTRDWNVSTTTMPLTEQMAVANFRLKQNQYFVAEYNFSNYRRGDDYFGEKQAGNTNWTYRGFNLNVNDSRLVTQSSFEKTNFERPHLDISKTFKFDNKKLKFINGFKAGFYIEQEQNQRKQIGEDTLLKNSFKYDLKKYYIELPTAKSGSNLMASFSERKDYFPTKNGFTPLSQVQELSLTANLIPKKNNPLNWTLTYRNLQVLDSTRTNLKPQETYVGRLDYNFNFLKKAVSGNTFYEIGSGQEQKTAYQYIKVRPGEGQYIWKNRHPDTIPHLDEFEISPFPDQADYVRVTLLTGNFVRTNNVQLNQSFRIEPRFFWSDTAVLKGFQQKWRNGWNRFSTLHTFQINRRVRADALTVSQWNPFELQIPDISLVALSQNIRNTLIFNRGNPTMDAEMGQNETRNRIVLATGFEERGKTEYSIRTRWNITHKITFQGFFAKGAQNNRSEAFLNRNYNILFQKIESQLTWLASNQGKTGQSFRGILAYKYRYGINSAKIDGESAKNHDFSLELTYNQANLTQLRSKCSYITVAYQGAKNIPVEFALLEGLQNGNNYLWQMSLEKTLKRNIQWNISYEGRSTGNLRIVHVGRAQVRANF
ncbi:MAG: hypothetical protein RLZZ628_3111 [Bacteroidota bacterium]